VPGFAALVGSTSSGLSLIVVVCDESYAGGFSGVVDDTEDDYH